MKSFIYLSMIFCHVIDDYCLQGILSSMKQKKWWHDNAPDELYKHDYIMALFMHSFSWSFMILLPIAIYNKFNIDLIYYIALWINCIIHLIVDDLKANKGRINLIADQIIHLIQIAISAIVLL